MLQGRSTASRFEFTFAVQYNSRTRPYVSHQRKVMVRLLPLISGSTMTLAGKNPAFGPAQIRDLTETFVSKALEVWCADASYRGCG